MTAKKYNMRKARRVNKYCEECYAANSRATPILNPEQCLKNHTQYIYGTCGRCIHIEQDAKRGVRR